MAKTSLFLQFRKKLAERIDPTEKGNIAFVVSSDGTITVGKKEFAASVTRKDIEQELAYFKDPYANLGMPDYNPSAITISTYKKMAEDAQVYAGLKLITLSALSTSWHITHPDSKVSDWITKTLKKLKKPNFFGVMEKVLDALAYGFSIFEIVYSYDLKESKIILRPERGIKDLDPEFIEFSSSAKGELTEINQTLTAAGNILDLDRTFVFSYDMRYGNLYGRSLLRSCYKNWFIKDRMLRYANIAHEKHGAPIWTGTVKDPADIPEMLKVLKGMRATGSAAMTDAWKIQSMESKGWRGTVMPFVDYIRYQDEMIFRTMTIGSLVLGKEKAGAYSLGEVHFDAFKMSIESLRIDLCSTLDEIINKLVQFNFITTEPAEMHFEPFTEENLERIANIIALMLTGGVIEPDEEWIRERLKFPPKPKLEKAAPEKPIPSIESEGESTEEKKAAAYFQKYKTAKKGQVKPKILKTWKDEINRILDQVRIMREEEADPEEIKTTAMDQAHVFSTLIISTLANQTMKELSKTLGKKLKELPPESKRLLFRERNRMLIDFEKILDEELGRIP